MSQRPERPFIPSSTPTPARRAAGATSFHLTRPFVHGARTIAASGAGSVAAESMVESDDFGVLAGAASEAQSAFVSLPPIDDFLETVPDPAESYASPGDALDFNRDSQSSYDLPPVEHFLDPLPLVDALAPDNGDVVVADSMFGLEETGWVDTGWQQFDWSGAAALGEGSAEASDAWQETDWDTTAAPVREFRETAAQAIANALNEIANRIRKGELVVPPPNIATDPAAIAATLAALLGVRR